jgi:hypothetical protein
MFEKENFILELRVNHCDADVDRPIPRVHLIVKRSHWIEEGPKILKYRLPEFQITMVRRMQSIVLRRPAKFEKKKEKMANLLIAYIEDFRLSDSRDKH